MVIAWEQRLLLILAAAALLVVTFELIRKRRLREEYAVLWVCTAIMILVFAVLPRALFAGARWLGLEHSVLLTFLCGVFLAAIVLHYSVVISKLSGREKGLAQELALLKEEMERLQGELEEAKRPRPEPKPKPPALRT